MRATSSMEKSKPDQVNTFLAEQNQKELLRFITCGSVDDGKSTLIGRLLYEAQLLFDDQVEALSAESKKMGTQGDSIDFSLLVDGLSAEREQGITIDVAYRFFSTNYRKFIVADTPGHKEYTRNMATGASTAEVAIVLVDATNGILEQTCRHAFICSVMGIKKIILAVNKMDLVDYSQVTYDEICSTFETLRTSLNFEKVYPIPLSALRGENITTKSIRMDWYKGSTLMGLLEGAEVESAYLPQGPAKLPVQLALRPDSEFRGFAGTLTNGSLQVDEEIIAFPSLERANIKKIFLGQSELTRAIAPQAVTVTLDREIDVSRGSVLVAADSEIDSGKQFNATVVWLTQEAGFVGRSYIFQFANQFAGGSIIDIRHGYDLESLSRKPSSSLAMNEIAEVEISLDKAVVFESFQKCKVLGSFIIVDRISSNTVAAGILNFALRRDKNLFEMERTISREDKETVQGHKGLVIWMTGFSGAGKSTIANGVEAVLHREGLRTAILDGDSIRKGLSKDLGFTAGDRIENTRRVSEVAKILVDLGLIVIVALISPFRSERESIRKLFGTDDFREVYVKASKTTVESRDPKGLYQRVARGDIKNFTGKDSVYEPPTNPELIIDTDISDKEQSIMQLADYIKDAVANYQ